jgi:asparagine synthase (glutamine-hydrolysing)
VSGIVGVLHLDGQPADRDLIESMTASLTFRGPDGQQVWTGASVAFGHSLLKTTFEAESESQPASIDGQVWITADARIDARDDLARELGLPRSALRRPDCEFILHAYARWGESCVDHLLGDFAFAIWDARSHKLFCARDHFGIKPFYYAHLGNTFVLSNTLDCVRAHPAVSDGLNELAIADFLVFGFNQEFDTTTFADIRRLPPAHTLVVTVDGVVLRKYWSLPEGERVRYRRTRDYVEHFRSLFEAATADRLRTSRVAVMMSGGLDSPSVAAFARKARPETELTAHTIVYDSLIPDDERHFAGLVAEALGIPIEFAPVDGVRPYDPVPNFSTPEPVHEPVMSFTYDHCRGIACHTPVILTGHGGDPLFCVSPLMNWASVRAIPPLHTGLNFARYLWEYRAVPRLRLRSTLWHLLGRIPASGVDAPNWLSPALASRCGMAERAASPSGVSPKHEPRPLARRGLRSVLLASAFETDDSAYVGAAFEYRHPFFDLRLAGYLLAIPELPYSMDKYLLRAALRGMLPETVRKRAKTPLRADPLQAAFRRHGLGVKQPVQANPQLHDFVDPSAIPLLAPDVSPERLWIDSRVLSLNGWFQSQEKTRKCKTKKTAPLANRIVPPNYASTATFLN